jgi:hypothetical protein
MPCGIFHFRVLLVRQLRFLTAEFDDDKWSSLPIQAILATARGMFLDGNLVMSLRFGLCCDQANVTGSLLLANVVLGKCMAKSAPY